MEPIMISLQMIRDKSPCTDGWRKVKAANSHREMDELFPMSDILESNDLADTLWAARCVDSKDDLWRKFALWCAKQSLQFTKDKRAHDCLEVVERYLNGNATIGELRRARSDVYDVMGTSSAADTYAASAAAAAADAAAYSAATAADAADAAAYSAAATAAAAADTAYSDDKKEARESQKNKLKQILDSGEWVE